jgi:ribosomal protein S18 acetylase RimI-like enzyme
MTARPFQEQDRAAVIALWHDCGLVVPWNPPEGDLDRALANESSTVLVAEDETGQIEGSVMVGDDGHRGWVYYVSASPSAQKTGIGRALMGAAEAWLTARGVRKAELMVRNTNDGVLGFYDALGYQREPVYVLSKWLIENPKGDHS